MLVLTAFVLTPGLTLLTLGGSFLRFGLLFVATAISVALLDAVLSFERLKNLRVESEPKIHAIVGQPFDVRLRVYWAQNDRPPLTLAFDVPGELEEVQFPPRITFKGTLQPSESIERNSSGFLVVGKSQTLERGRYALKQLHTQTDSHLGFFWVRRTLNLDVLIHSYPDLKSDRRLLAAKNFAKEVGVIATLLTGRGRSFDRLREYVPGDEMDDIHWRATAKRRKPITKLYELEKDQRIYVAIDQSRLSARSSPRNWPVEEQPLSLLERYINTALVLGSVAHAQGDQFGLLGFSDRVTSFSPAGSGPAHYKACRETILEFRSKRVNADYRELFTFFSTKVRRRSLLFILTSVDDPALCEELIESAKLVADRHLVIAAAVTPAHANSLANAEPIESAEQITERLAAHLLWKRLRQTAQALGQNGVRFLSLEHETMVPHIVSSYARIKRGQLL